MQHFYYSYSGICLQVGQKMSVVLPVDQNVQTTQSLWTKGYFCPLVYKRMYWVWCRLIVYLFATQLSKKFPVDVPQLPDPMAWKEDTFLQPWDYFDWLTFPPFPLILRVLNWMLMSFGLRVTIVVLWSSWQEWCPD